VLDLTPEKILVLGVLALVVLGPNRLPGAARTLGRVMGQLKTMSASFQSEVRDALHEPTEAFESAFGEFDLGRVGNVGQTVRRAVTSTVMPSETLVAPGTQAVSGTQVPPGPASYGPPPASEGGPGWPGWPAVPDDPGLN
jgi:sec-independent protein translocase protein TatB